MGFPPRRIAVCTPGPGGTRQRREGFGRRRKAAFEAALRVLRTRRDRRRHHAAALNPAGDEARRGGCEQEHRDRGEDEQRERDRARVVRAEPVDPAREKTLGWVASSAGAAERRPPAVALAVPGRAPLAELLAVVAGR